jgi:Homocysteine S-methyltransferase
MADLITFAGIEEKYVVGICDSLIAADVPHVNAAIRKYKMRGRNTLFHASMPALAAAADVSQHHGLRVEQVRDFECRWGRHGVRLHPTCIGRAVRDNVRIATRSVPTRPSGWRIGKSVRYRHCPRNGNICNTNAFEADDPRTHKAVRAMFEEQIGWAAEEGADFLIAETIDWYGEAAGADVVGLNCQRGPKTLMPVVRKVRQAVACHVASLPVPYRTTDAEPTFQSLTDRACACIPGNRPFPTALDPFTCNRYECAEYAREAHDMGVHYIGLCCGAAPHHIRAVAEALGRTVPGSRYSPDMSKHAFFGTDAMVPDKYKDRKVEI